MITILIRAVNWFSWLITTLIFIRAIMSWFMIGARSQSIAKVYDTLVQFTEPFIAPFRNLLSKFYNGPIDFSPLFAMLAIEVIARVVVVLLGILR